ncbi:hypothetical protein EW026_g2600 [Hermanssonia centrifuga]|uniref:Monopolin complex subunit Csm1/Pcs1 C-terminal domain-containing protein n=1 Tax=Hermanssonia centrifuga TaxID=98765 RepID=A0A4S4KMT3_9APHY|nr:hypothetical protein EW026_g2600 [Hermanssonia centrifuga]
MSSDDEFGVQTCVRLMIFSKSAPKPRPAVRAVAGPSSKPGATAAKRNQRKAQEVAETEVEGHSEVLVVSSGDEDKTDKAPVVKGKRKATEPSAKVVQPTTHLNGGPTAKAKGKAKADLADIADEMDVDEEQVVVDDIPKVRPSKGRTNAKTSPSSHEDASTRRAQAEADALRREIARLQKRIEDADSLNENLGKQLQEIHQTRFTDAEQSANERVEQQQALVQEKELQSQLDNEIQMAMAQAKSTSGSTRNGTRTDDPKFTKAIKLYEDLTNFLILSVTTNKSPHYDYQETCYTCVYTLTDENGANPSLNFTLRHMWIKGDTLDPTEPVISRDELESKMQYSPLHLDKESEDFKRGLDFFRDPFLFSTDQVHIFLKTLQERLSAIQNPEGQAEG